MAKNEVERLRLWGKAVRLMVAARECLGVAMNDCNLHDSHFFFISHRAWGDLDECIEFVDGLILGRQSCDGRVGVDPKRCVQNVKTGRNIDGRGFRQCSYRRGHGFGGAYCVRHASTKLGRRIKKGDKHARRTNG